MSEYEESLERQAQQYASKSSLTLNDIRELLILSAAKSCSTAHSYFESRRGDSGLLGYLLATIRDTDGYFSGDARMRAAFYLSRLDSSMLRGHADELLALYEAEDGEGVGGCLRGLLSRALAVAKVEGGRERILADSNPERFDNWLFVEALRMYDQTN